MKSEQVILVDSADNESGFVDKLEAHEKGMLHRAFSIFIFNRKGEMLLQQRALQKYHSGGLWTNACCSHPQPGEDTSTAATRRLKEEMGFETGLKKIFDFVYKAKMDRGLIEHEFDHVFIGEYADNIPFNPEEVKAISYLSMQEIRQELETEPGKFTAWFQIAFPDVDRWWKENYKDSVVGST